MNPKNYWGINRWQLTRLCYSMTFLTFHQGCKLFYSKDLDDSFLDYLEQEDLNESEKLLGHKQMQ